MMQIRGRLFIKAMIRYAAGCCMPFFFSLLACTKDPSPVKVTITPLQTLINSDSNLSFYHRLIIQANETGLLADHSVTLLIPTNKAFQDAGYTQNSIDSLLSSQADAIVRYLFIPSALSIPLAGNSPYAPYTTLSGNPIYGMSDGQKIWFNGAGAIQDTARTGNAIVYRLDRVLPPSSDSLNHFLDGDTTLSFLAEAFRQTHIYDSLLLSGGSYTLLAPVNSAFRNAGYDSLPSIDSANLDSLARLINYHVVTGVFFTNTLAGQTSLTTREGAMIAVSQQSGQLQFMGNGNTTPALFLSGNQVAGKTIVVQRISQLLLP